MTGGPVLSLAPGPRLPFFPSMTRAELARLLGAPPSPAGKSRVWVEAAVPGEFQREFAAAVAGAGEVFLGDGRRGAEESGSAGGKIG